MILREYPLRIAVAFLILGLAFTEAQNARSYDTSDWIPITKQEGQGPPSEKRATGRVLNLPETPRGKSFFPEQDGGDQNARQQYHYREQNVEITPAQLQQYYVTQGPLQSHPQGQVLLKQNYPNLPLPQQFLLQQPQKASNATIYNPLGIGVQTINHELLGARDDVYKQVELTSTTAKTEGQNVQLLYVPVEQLQNKQQQNFQRSPPTYDLHKQQQLVNIQKDFIQQALEAHKLQQQLQAYPSHTLPVYTSTLPPSTLKPVSRKRIPHQPPLAVYMNGNKDAEVFDVLNVLKNSKSIEVQDAVSPYSPQIFVGPANLEPPNGYAKFDLPYLSNIDSNRVERKVDQPPFFVAPLNYKTPPGYSKIPLPSPHVGSVVVSTKHADEKPQFTVILDDAQQNFKQYNVGTTAAPPVNLYTSENLDTTTQYYVRRQPSRSGGRQRGKTAYPNHETQSQNAYAKIHDVRTAHPNSEAQSQSTYAEIHDAHEVVNTTPPPSGNLQSYSSAPQIRQKQQTSFYPQQYQEVFSAPPPPAPKNFYSELDYTPPQQEETQPRIEDLFSIIPPPPTNTNAPVKNDAFDLGQAYPQFRKPPDDYQKFDQLFQTAFLPHPNLNQVENNPNVYSDQVKSAPKPTAPEQTEGKYTVLEEFSINPKTTTPTQASQPIGETTRKPQQEDTKAYREPPQDYYEQDDYQVQVQPQVLPGLINELQDQSVRQLLAPALLAPTTTTTTEKVYYTQNPVAPPDYDYAYQALTTTQAPPTATEAPQVETTTPKRTRGRGNSRFNQRASATSAPRRNTHRARTQHPSRSRYTTTHAPNANQEIPTRQRFRTRGRPLSKNEDPTEKLNFEITTAPPTTPPLTNSYYEVEQARPQFIAKSKVLSPEEEYLVKKYNLAYSIAGENQNLPLRQDVLTPKGVNIQLEVVTTRAPLQIAPVYAPTESSNHRTTEQGRIRGRFRSKTKIPPTTTTTPAPTTFTTTQTIPRVEVKVASDNEEFYGFLRKPHYDYNEAEPKYRGADLNYNYNNGAGAEQNNYKEPLYSPSYVSSTIQPPANHVASDNKPADVVIQNPVQFIGEIRPKFHSTTTEPPTTPKYYISTTTTETPKKRVRGRIRVPSRLVTSAESPTEAASTAFEEVIPTTTRRGVVLRTRGRGKAQFRLPEVLAKGKTGDEEVEGGNYPRPFTKPTSTEKQVFQIAAIDPTYDEEEDQLPFASIHRPKIVAPNDIPVDAKMTTEIEELEATTLPPRKKGFWKLVGQKPVDEFEAAESQNVGTVSVNSFAREEKLQPEVATDNSTPDFFDSIYQTFGLVGNVTENWTSAAPEEATQTTTETETTTSGDIVSVKTSTSTEISRETEICYKGVCVKTKDVD